MKDKDVYNYITEHCKYCALCGSTWNLHRHHIIYRSEGGPTDYWNIIILCEHCHMMVHSNKRYWQKKLIQILTNIIIYECHYNKEIRDYVLNHYSLLEG